jgi:hypothetical protein
VDPVPDPLLLRNPGKVENQTRTSGSVARTVITRPRGSLLLKNGSTKGWFSNREGYFRPVVSNLG